MIRRHSTSSTRLSFVRFPLRDDRGILRLSLDPLAHSEKLDLTIEEKIGTNSVIN